MTYTWIRMGEPRLRGKVRGPAVEPPGPTCDLVLDTNTDPRFGFEVVEDYRALRRTGEGDNWSNATANNGWQMLLDSSNGANGQFRESIAGGSPLPYPEAEKVEGDYFYWGATVGDNQQWGHYGFWDSDNFPINEVDGYLYPGTAAINEGDTLSVRVAAFMGGSDYINIEVSFWDSDDNPIGEVNPFDNPLVVWWSSLEGAPIGEWHNVIVGHAPGLPGLDDYVAGSAITAPADAAYYSLVVNAGTAFQGGTSYTGVDALLVCRTFG